MLTVDLSNGNSFDADGKWKGLAPWWRAQTVQAQMSK